MNYNEMLTTLEANVKQLINDRQEAFETMREHTEMEEAEEKLVALFQAKMLSTVAFYAQNMLDTLPASIGEAVPLLATKLEMTTEQFYTDLANGATDYNCYEEWNKFAEVAELSEADAGALVNFLYDYYTMEEEA